MKKKKLNYPEAILIRCKRGTKKALDSKARRRSRADMNNKSNWTRSDVARDAIASFLP